MITSGEAQRLILNEARSFGKEKIALEKSFGRVLAQDVRADRDYPPFNRSAMDGFAIVAENYSAEKTYKISKTVFAGDASKIKPQKGSPLEAIKIMTGAAVPLPFNAVIRREDAVAAGASVRFSNSGVKQWQNISLQGEDITRGEKIAAHGRLIDSATASLLASLGIVRPLVSRLPQVAIISTGNEIISPAKNPNPVQIRNSNIFALKCQLKQYCIEKIDHVHVADDRKKLQSAIGKYGKADILLLTGGVSAGDSDYVPEVLAQLKFKKIFHKIQIKPGKPLWFGRRGNTVVFAIPGNPLSAQVIFRIFIEPYLRRCLGRNAAQPLALPLSEGRRKKDTLENFFPVKVDTNSNLITSLAQLSFNGSGDVRAALFSDGLAAHPADRAELAAGSVVGFYPWRAL